VRSAEIGSTGVTVTELGFGGGGLGELWVKVSDDQAWATLEAAWDGGIRFFDTAPFYGFGLSEHRLGRFLRGQERSEFTASTKIGRILRAPRDPAAWKGDGLWIGGLPFDQVWDFTYDGVMRSYEDSLQRLGLNRVDMLVIHDLDTWQFQGAELEAQWSSLRESGWRALAELRAAGIIGAVGAGVNVVGTGADKVSDVSRFIDTCELDFIIIAGRYTLLDQTALDDLSLCRRQGVDAIVGAVFNTGILSRGAGQPATFDYQAAPPGIIERAERLAEVCERHDVPLRAAAIQFPLAHDAVRSVLSGPVTPDEARDSLDAFEHRIPEALWDELRGEGLIAEGAPTPKGRAPHDSPREVT
jgi:D-threo-aldose 1-dehydrogenase